MIFLRAYSHVLVQKAGAIQNPADIDVVDESGVRLSNEVGKLLVGARLVNSGIQNHLRPTPSCPSMCSNKAK